MLAPKVIKHHVECDRRAVLNDALRKAVCKSSEAPHAHAHREVRALDIEHCVVVYIAYIILSIVGPCCV